VNNPVSIPYLQCTLDVMARCNVFVEHHAYQEFHISGGQQYQSREWLIPEDWSSVATLLVAGSLLADGEYLVPLPDSTIAQADAYVLSVLKKAGIRFGLKNGHFVAVHSRPLAFETDLSHSPDLFPVLSVLAVFTEGVSVLHGIDRLKIKESDRSRSIAEMLSACGVEVEIRSNSLAINGCADIRHGAIKSYGDHRIAMAATILGMAGNGCIIDDTSCVAKSFPGFFSELGL
jgi:3-phosphoshikimate 1-carboxyvinyltransferase